MLLHQIPHMQWSGVQGDALVPDVDGGPTDGVLLGINEEGAQLFVGGVDLPPLKVELLEQVLTGGEIALRQALQSLQQGAKPLCSLLQLQGEVVPRDLHPIPGRLGPYTPREAHSLIVALLRPTVFVEAGAQPVEEIIQCRPGPFHLELNLPDALADLAI